MLLGRTVALNLLHPELSRDDTFRLRLQREARAVASLNHPAIVAIYDTGEESVVKEEEQLVVPYIVMEFIEGRTLSEELRSRSTFSLDHALTTVADILQALHYCHQNGIIHRDIQPGHVMLTSAGRVKLIGFAFARPPDDTPMTADMLGSSKYVSPEMIRGQRVDRRSDVYYTGCLLFELLTGRQPFETEDDAALLWAYLQGTPPPPSHLRPDLPPELDTVVQRAMANEPADRYQTAEEFRVEVEAIAKSADP